MANQTIVRQGMQANQNTPGVMTGWGPGSLISNAFNHQVYDLNNMDVQHMQVYDTVAIAAGGNVSPLTVSYFSSVGAQSGKTAAQTNLDTPNQLQTPEAFSIMSFRLGWTPNVLLADLLTVLNNFDFEFTIGKKIYQQAPIDIFAYGGGVWGVIAPSSSSAFTSLYTNGWPDRAGMNRLNIPLVIDNTAQFKGYLNGTPQTLTVSGSGGTGFTSKLVLDGFYARGIQ